MRLRRPPYVRSFLSAAATAGAIARRIAVHTGFERVVPITGSVGRDVARGIGSRLNGLVGVGFGTGTGVATPSRSAPRATYASTLLASTPPCRFRAGRARDRAARNRERDSALLWR